ncbi:MAG: hypothetical protein AAF458_04110 [Pseudomonadota bacterium]
MKLRAGDSWLPAPDYGRHLATRSTGVSINLLVTDVAAAVGFQCDVLGAEAVYQDVDFAALAGFGSEWCVHADHTYDRHPMAGVIRNLDGRGAGVELRVYGCDPDAAERRARDAGHTVLAGALDKPHGLRESYLLDRDGYCWVPSVPVGAGSRDG